MFEASYFYLRKTIKQLKQYYMPQLLLEHSKELEIH